MAGGELAEDLREIPEQAKYLALRGKARNLPRLRLMHELEVLWASGITQQLVAELPALPKLRALNLYQVGRTDLSPVGQLREVQHLLIGWANHLVDLSWLAHLPRLQTLAIDGANRLGLGSAGSGGATGSGKKPDSKPRSGKGTAHAES